MDIIDELRQEAQEKKRHTKQPMTDIPESDGIDDTEFKDRAKAALTASHRYLKELVETLKDSQQKIRVAYDLEGFGELSGLEQGGYLLEANSSGPIGSLTMSFTCTANRTVPIRCGDASHAIHQREYLRDNEMRYREAGGRFLVDARVLVQLIFDVDMTNKRIRLTTKNLDRLGETTYKIKVEDFGKALMEEIAKAVLRRPNKLNELTGFSISEDVRTQLKERLAREARQKDAEGLESSGAEAEEKKGLFGSLFKKH